MFRIRPLRARQYNLAGLLFTLATLALFAAWPAESEADEAASETDPDVIDVYETESTRAPSKLLEVPQAISVVSREEIQRGRPAVTLDEALDLVPGVFAQGGRNFAQDSRVSIRGYGARAQFGVRGIRLLIDGVPNTLPDGQTEIDSLDLAFVERIEVMRGPVSSLYGGGGGGMISVETLSPTATPSFDAKLLFGTDHLSRYSATTTGTAGGTGYALGLAWTRTSGYREHARARQAVLFGKLEHELPGGTRLTASLNSVWAPEGQDPGGLQVAQVRLDRSDARPESLRGDAREKLNQQKLALSVLHPFSATRELRATIYGLQRDFANALPLSAFLSRRVDLDRTARGASLVMVDSSAPIRWTFGVDFDQQNDIRENFQNLFGLRGPLTLDQSETVRALGPFVQAEWNLPSGFGLIAGARYDWTEFKVGDRFVNGGSGDHSDRRRFRQLSPRLGVRYGPSPAFQTYANLVTGFRVPTTTELSEADGSLSSRLDAETTLGLEIGAKGVIGERIFYDLALFDLRLRDVSVPFEDAAGNSLFRDAGEVRRRGVEAALSMLIGSGLSARLGYTYADYRYHDYDFVDLTASSFRELDGKREPNTPQHAFSGELRYDRGAGPFAVLSLRHYSDIEADDANTAESPGATLTDARFGWTLRRGRATFQPFVGARNWTKVEYDQTLRPNAGGGRFFEPAPETELYVGIEVGYD